MTNSGSHKGILVLSVDSPGDGNGQVEVRRLFAEQRTAQELLKLLLKRRIPATWATPHPATWPLLPQLLTGTMQHDLALLGDQTWIGKTAGRTRFAQELASRLNAVRAAAVDVSAIAVADAASTEHLDLLVKNRITLIRGPAAVTPPSLQPQSPRFGVWLAPVSAVFPQRSWSLLGPTWTVRQAVRRAIRVAGIVHVVIDVDRIAMSGNHLRQLDAMLGYIDGQRQKGRLRIVTMTGLAERLTRKRSVRPTRSILRAA